MGGTAPRPGSKDGVQWPKEITTRLESLYINGLAKKYEHEHLDNPGLQNRYVQKGLTTQREHELEEKLYREFKLVDNDGRLILR